MNKLLILVCIFLTTACSTIPKNQLQSSTLSSDVNFVINMTKNKNIETVCSYKGRVVLKYEDNTQKTSLNAIVDKTCDNSSSIKILGAFGIPLAEVTLDSAGYTISKNGVDITDEQELLINQDDMILINGHISLPTPLPDKNYSMISSFVDNNPVYIFLGSVNDIVLSSDFRVQRLFMPGYNITYGWENDILKTMNFSKNDTMITITFVDKWITK